MSSLTSCRAPSLPENPFRVAGTPNKAAGRYGENRSFWTVFCRSLNPCEQENEQEPRHHVRDWGKIGGHPRLDLEPKPRKPSATPCSDAVSRGIPLGSNRQRGYGAIPDVIEPNWVEPRGAFEWFNKSSIESARLP